MNHDDIKQSNLIDQYVLGQLAPDVAEEFEDHFIDCETCVEELNIARSFIGDLKGFTVQETLSWRKEAEVARLSYLPQFPSFRSRAVAGVCLVVLALIVLFGLRWAVRKQGELRQAKTEVAQSNQQLLTEKESAAEAERKYQEERQQLAQRVGELEKNLKNNEEDRGSKGAGTEINFPIYALLAIARTQEQHVTELDVSAASSKFALSIQIEGATQYSDYRVTIIDQRQATVFKQPGFKPDRYHALSLSLNSNFLSPGKYELKVDGRTSSGDWTAVGTYLFRFSRRH